MKRICLSIIIWSILIPRIYAQPGLYDYEHLSHWRAVLNTPGGDLAFQMNINTFVPGILLNVELINGNEVINLELKKDTLIDGNDTILVSHPNIKSKDTFSFRMAVFNTEIRAKFADDIKSMNGIWYDHSRPGNYYLPFHAELIPANEKIYRFIKNPLPAKANISGRYDAVFKDESSTDSTIAIFEQKENHLTGTFLTTTGDYRFLEGEVSADSFYLSAFDGSHAFLFKGEIHDDGTLSGGYWSGKHYHANFTAMKNENAKLPDPKKLTYLNDGYSKIEFSFPDENGNLISLDDERFKNKVVVIQITGSWCPNCMDETSYMSEVEEKYKNKDLAIVALSFERQPDPQNFKINIDRLKNHFGIDYLYLNAGLPKNASDALPMLNHVMGFPTTIILNKKHEVTEIYTGFNGPATGQLFLDYQKDFEELVERLMNDQ